MLSRAKFIGEPDVRQRRNGTTAREGRRQRRRKSDPTLNVLVGQMIAARVRAGFTQEQVASKMRTTKSAISRLDSGSRNRPTLTTIENYALVVGCQVEVRLRRLLGEMGVDKTARSVTVS